MLTVTITAKITTITTTGVRVKQKGNIKGRAEIKRRITTLITTTRTEK